MLGSSAGRVPDPSALRGRPVHQIGRDRAAVVVPMLRNDCVCHDCSSYCCLRFRYVIALPWHCLVFLWYVKYLSCSAPFLVCRNPSPPLPCPPLYCLCVCLVPSPSCHLFGCHQVPAWLFFQLAMALAGSGPSLAHWTCHLLQLGMTPVGISASLAPQTWHFFLSASIACQHLSCVLYMSVLTRNRCKSHSYENKKILLLKADPYIHR